MGVRDYDPNLAQFHTPDPLFLGDPGRCLASPLECNLYAYAAGNPIAFTDPSGLGIRSWARKAVNAVGSAAESVGEAIVDYGPQIAGATVGAIAGCATAGPAGCVVGARYGMVIGGALGAGFGYAAKSLVTGDGDVQGTIDAMAWGAITEMGGQIAGRVVSAAAAPAYAKLTTWWAKQRASVDNLRSLMNVSMAGGPAGRPRSLPVPVLTATNRRSVAEAIANHTFDKVGRVGNGRVQFKAENMVDWANRIERLIERATERGLSKSLMSGRRAYWEPDTKSLIIHNARKPSESTIYRPTDGIAAYSQLR